MSPSHHKEPGAIHPAGQRAYFSHIPLITAAAAVSLTSLLPVIFIVAVAYQTGWATASELIFRPRVGELLLNTTLLVITTIPLAVLLAITLAWFTERTDIKAVRFFRWVAVAPLAVPAFVHSYAWVSLIPGMHGLPGGLLVSLLAYFPFMYLPIAAQLRRLDPAVEDAAAALGKGPWTVFFVTVLPQLRLAICGGSLLVGLHLLSEYGLYVMIRFDTFTTAIMDQFQSAFNGPAANLLGGVLVVFCFSLLGAERFLRGGERYARIGPGAARQSNPRKLGNCSLIGPAICSLVALLSLGVPLLTLGRWLYIGGLEAWRLEFVGSALIQTALLAFGGAFLTTLLAFPMAWLSVRGSGKLQQLMEACHYYVGSLPGVVVALALVTITVKAALPLYQTTFTLFLAYSLLFLPRALVGLRASIAQVPVELEQAAMALGRTPGQALREITIRLAAPGGAVAMAFVGLGITNELTATLLLAPNGTRTLATQFWSLTSEIDYVAAAPYALLMIGLSLPMTILLHSQSKRISGR